jgi:tRNA (guanine-N7-)-methyltransferase
VRSFVRRAGRLTSAQARALAEFWPRYGIEYQPEPLDLRSVFGRSAPVTLEIGFGNGAALLALAAAAPGEDFLGIEVHDPGVGHCLLGIDRAALTNVRLIRHDAVPVLEHQLTNASLQRVLLYFPDPWPKKRHHKRRIVQAAFVELLARRLAPGGRFEVATDWPPYAEHIETTVGDNANFEVAGRAGVRPATRFEARGLRLGHPIWEACYVRRGG